MVQALTVIIPVFNEDESIIQTITDVHAVLLKIQIPFEIIVVNDGSTDATAGLLTQSPVSIVRIEHDENRGYGYSIMAGVQRASHELICIIDADGTYPADMIMKLYEKSEMYDMVVGARVDKNARIPLLRRPAKYVLTLLANYLTLKKIPDLNSGLRIFRKSIVLHFRQFFPAGFSFTTTITVLMLCRHYRVYFMPVQYFRRKGRSKISPVKDTLNFFLLILRMITYFRPLRFFIPLSLFLFVIGSGKLVHDIMKYHFHVTENTVLMLIFSAQFFILGLIADLIITLNINKQ